MKNDLIFYLLANPAKIDDLQFSEEYISDNIVRIIFRELKNECKKFNQIIPLEKSKEIINSNPRLKNFSNQLMNTIEIMYSTGFHLLTDIKIDPKFELNVLYEIKQMILAGKKQFQLSVLENVKNYINSNNKVSSDKLQSILQKEILKNKQYFDDIEDIEVYSNMFDSEFQKSTVEETVNTGIPGFDKYLTGGFLKKTINVIQAATGKGKTTMLVSLATNMLMLKYNVAFVNLEMKAQDFQYNIYSSVQDKYSFNEIREKYNEKHPDFISKLQDEIISKELGEYVMLKSNSFESLNCKQLEDLLLNEEASRNIKFDVVLIDYLGLLRPYLIEKGNDRNDLIIQRTMREFKIMCDRNNWVGITATQENRPQNGYDGKSSPNNIVTNPMTRISNSFAQLFEADNFISFERVLDTNKIKVQFCKYRQWSEIETPKPFFMEYNSKKKRYVNTDDNIEYDIDSFNYKNIVDILHNKVKQIDIINLCKKFNVGPSTVETQIKKYYSKKNYQSINAERIDVNSINNLETFLNSYMKKSNLQLDLNFMEVQNLFN